MTAVVIGHRRYGRVHTHGGEYAETVFAHLSFLPIVPLASYWVTSEAGPAERVGFPIKLNGRSVLAAYLRTWMAAVSLATFLAPSLAATAVASAFAGLSAWSWTWRPSSAGRSGSVPPAAGGEVRDRHCPATNRIVDERR